MLVHLPWYFQYYCHPALLPHQTTTGAFSFCCQPPYNYRHHTSVALHSDQSLVYNLVHLLWCFQHDCHPSLLPIQTTPHRMCLLFPSCFHIFFLLHFDTRVVSPLPTECPLEKQIKGPFFLSSLKHLKKKVLLKYSRIA